MQRRDFLQGMGALGLVGASPALLAAASAGASRIVSVEQLPKLVGELTLYLGRGEGGLYENVLDAIKKRNPDFDLKIRRGPTAALANAIVAEAKANVRRADVFWAVDSGAIGLLTDKNLASPLPADLTAQLRPEFQFPNWAPVTGRIRTLAYNTERLTQDQIPKSIKELAESDLTVAWAPAYASFQSFVTAMRLLVGEAKTIDWLRSMKKRSKRYAGELGVVLAAERGEVDLGLANHYYTLRLKSGKPKAKVDLAFTHNDAGCLVNASGIVALKQSDLAVNFIRYLLTKEVQTYLASEAYEIPLVGELQPPAGLPNLQTISPPKVDLTQLANLRPTLNMMRKAGVL